MSLAFKILKTSLVYSLLSYFSFAIGIFGQIVLARLIAPEFFVPFVTSLAFIEIIYAFGSIGLNNVLLTYQKEPKIFGTSFFLVTFLSSCLFILCIGSSFIFLEKELLQIIILLTFAKSISMYSTLFTSFLEKDFHHSLIGLFEVIAKIIAISIAIYFAFIGIKTYALIYKEIIYSILFTGALFLYVTKSIEYKFNPNTAKKVFNFSFKFFIIGLVEVSIKNLPILFLSKFSGNSSAYFERGYYLGGLPNTFLSPVNSRISYAFYVKLKDQLHRIKKGVYLNISFSYRLILPITIIVIIFSKEIVLLIYGEQWIEVGRYLKYLAGLFIFLPLFAILKFFLISHNRIDIVFKTRIYSFISLILGIFFIYHFSLDFKYIALLLSIIYFFSFIYLMVITNKKLKIDLKRLFFKPFVIAILLIPVLLIPKLHWMIISWFYLLLYLSMLIISEKESLMEIINLLKGRRFEKKSNFNKT